ncbi:serine/threonine protein kinase [Singulisphaera sp. PoT]|uniref:serine/threonine protein kinase n=1 Tax=Singulisphaera sp. PoT TaxID=3411797 RepID=UPI003BF5F102
MREELGFYWFHHARTRFDGRYHRCPDQEEYDIEINRRPRERTVVDRAHGSGPRPKLLRPSWIVLTATLCFLAGGVTPSAFAARAPGARGGIPLEDHSILRVAAESESNPKAEAGNGLLTSWLGREISGGRYQLLEVASEGPAGTSFRARDRNLDVDVLIEVPHAPMTERAAFAARFNDGVRRLSLMDHAHLVKIVEVGKSADWPYSVVEHHDGGSLKFRRPTGSDGRPIPASPQGLAGWLPEVAKVLDFLHARGHIHRDIRPSNIVFDEQGQAYLGGLGMSEAINAAYEARPAQAQNLATLTFGSPGYMAPELAAGLPVDGQADQYALAAIVYEFLVGRLPFEGHSAMGVLVQQLTKDPSDLHQICPEVSNELSSAVLRGLARDPRDRFPDCSAFAQGVLAAAVTPENRGISHAPPTPPWTRGAISTKPLNRSPPRLRLALTLTRWQSAAVMALTVAFSLLLRWYARASFRSEKGLEEVSVPVASAPIAQALRVYTHVEIQDQTSTSLMLLPMYADFSTSSVPAVEHRGSRIRRLVVGTRRFLKAALRFDRLEDSRKPALSLTATMSNPTPTLSPEMSRSRPEGLGRVARAQRGMTRKTLKYREPLRHRAG